MQEARRKLNLFKIEELGQRYDFDLDGDVFRETGDLHGRAGRRIGREVFAVHLIHRSKFGHVLEENGGLHDLFQRSAGSREDALDILQHALGLRLDVAFHDLLSRGIERNLSGEENESVRTDSLRIRADGFGTLVGSNDVAHAQHLTTEAKSLTTKDTKVHEGIMSAGDLYLPRLRRRPTKSFVELRVLRG